MMIFAFTLLRQTSTSQQASLMKKIKSETKTDWPVPFDCHYSDRYHSEKTCVIWGSVLSNQRSNNAPSLNFYVPCVR